MAITPERAEKVASIIRDGGITDEEVRHHAKSLTKKNVDRSPYYDATTETIRQNGRISVEEMLLFPSAPKKSDRNTRNKAIKLAQERLGVSIKRKGNFYVVDEDEQLISELLEILRTKESIDLYKWYNTKKNHLTLQFKQVKERLLKEGITIKSGVAKYDR